MTWERLHGLIDLWMQVSFWDLVLAWFLVVVIVGSVLVLLIGDKRKRQRLELRYLSYAEADRLIRETQGAWTIAPEEDGNRVLGMVYLERLAALDAIGEEKK